MITIQNQFLEVGVHEKGAELASIRSVRTGLEYIWEADPAFWGRHSCILFPVIGATHQGVIQVNGVQYPMTKHGIVRDQIFELESLNETSVSFSVSSDVNSKKHFPFDFQLVVTYTLDDNVCHVDYGVSNEGASSMPFSIGGHPGFNVPLYSDQKRSDYKLIFDQKEAQSSPRITDEGLIGKESVSILDNSSEIQLTDDLFDHDALILENYNSATVSIVDLSDKEVIKVNIEGFSHLGIWSKNRESPFVCIEPWYGIADPEGYQGEFRDKPGIQIIEPDEEFSCRHSIQIVKP